MSGTIGAAVHHGLTIPAHSTPGLKGGWLGVVATYPSEMAQNFYTAIWAFSACLLVTIGVSLVTKPKPAEELKGLVYSLTPKPEDPAGLAWYQKPSMVAIGILLAISVLNLLFW